MLVLCGPLVKALGCCYVKLGVGGGHQQTWQPAPQPLSAFSQPLEESALPFSQASSPAGDQTPDKTDKTDKNSPMDICLPPLL